MKYSLIIAVIVLSGCQTMPTTQSLPSLPAELNKSCQELKLLEGKVTTLSKLMETVAANYKIYHDCAAHQQALLEWYEKQSNIFNGN
jgi:hypothetical protein